MYVKPTAWTGRAELIDDLLFHQIVELIDLENESSDFGDIALIGFESDEGVRRNQGRVGAKDGPQAIRQALMNLAVHWPSDKFRIVDAGTVRCENGDLESASKELEDAISQILQSGSFLLILGGGHEVSYPHMAASKKEAKGSFGIINLDAHFDLRTYEQGAHSGSWARQLHDENLSNFHYLPIGINPAVNHREMFELMGAADQDIILLDELNHGLAEEVINRIDMFISIVDQISLTLDLDVMSAAYAPGVSALAPFGITSELTWQIIEHILDSGKVSSMDIAELNPKFDDGRTAKLAAQVIWKVISRKAV